MNSLVDGNDCIHLEQISNQWSCS